MSLVKVQCVIPVHLRIARCHLIMKRCHIYDCCWWRYSQRWIKPFPWSGETHHVRPSSEEEGSRQSHRGSGSRGKWARGFSEHRESCPRVSKRKWMDWPSTLINTRASSGIIRTRARGGTPGHLQSRLFWESDPWGLGLGGQSFLQCGPLQDMEPGEA